MKDAYSLVFTVEKVDGGVRHESFECRDMRDVGRTVMFFKVNEGEHLIGFNCQLVYVMDI